MKQRSYFLFLTAVMLTMLLSCTTETVSPDSFNSNSIETGMATATIDLPTSSPVPEQKETPTPESGAQVEEQTATSVAIETPTLTETTTPTPTEEFIPITNGPFTLVSVSSHGEQANGDAYDPAISADGRYIVFASEATNLIADDKNGAVLDVFLHDKVTGQTTLVSKNAAGEQGTGHSGSPGISADGEYITFWTGERGGAGLRTVLSWALYRYHLETEVFETILSTTDGSGLTPFSGDPEEVTRTPPTGAFTLNSSAGMDVKPSPIISQDGQSILFLSARPDIVPVSGGATGTVNIFVFRLP